MALKVRELTAEEAETIERLGQSRRAEARQVERARIIWYASQGEGVPGIARRLELSEQTVRMWLKRFNKEGLGGLQDQRRSGRPVTYDSDVVAEVIATALSDPQTLGLPFSAWTLDRLEAYLNEEKGIPIKRSRIDDLLRAEGLRWRKQESWFGERVDPDFAEKRGPSNGSTPTPLKGAS